MLKEYNRLKRDCNYCNILNIKQDKLVYYHSDSKVEQKWKEDFSSGKSNSCVVLTEYFGTETFTVKKQIKKENFNSPGLHQ